MPSSFFKSMCLALVLPAALAGANTAAVEPAAPSERERRPIGQQAPVATWKNVLTHRVTAGDVTFSYRELGPHHGGTPVLLLAHLAAVLDNWDPRIVDGLAAKHHVIAFDNRGVGASTGSPANTIEQMAEDAIRFMDAKGFKQVDLLGFSMGGMVAQEIVLRAPQRVRRMILAGTGPAGGLASVRWRPWRTLTWCGPP